MQIYRARSSLVWGWIAVAVGLVVAVWHTVSAGFAGAHGGLGLGIAMAAMGAAAFLRPHVAVAEDRVEMHNPVVTSTVPFSRLEALDTRWSLEARGDDGRKAGAFAAPAPGAAQSRRIEKQVAQETQEGAPSLTGRPGDAVGTPSGDASALVRTAWDAWTAAHPSAGAAPATGPSVARTLDPVGAALVTLGIAAAIWGLFF